MRNIHLIGNWRIAVGGAREAKHNGREIWIATCIDCGGDLVCTESMIGSATRCRKCCSGKAVPGTVLWHGESDEAGRLTVHEGRSRAGGCDEMTPDQWLCAVKEELLRAQRAERKRKETAEAARFTSAHPEPTEFQRGGKKRKAA